MNTHTHRHTQTHTQTHTTRPTQQPTNNDTKQKKTTYQPDVPAAAGRRLPVLIKEGIVQLFVLLLGRRRRCGRAALVVGVGGGAGWSVVGWGCVLLCICELPRSVLLFSLPKHIHQSTAVGHNSRTRSAQRTHSAAARTRARACAGPAPSPCSRRAPGWLPLWRRPRGPEFCVCVFLGGVVVGWGATLG